MIAWGKRGKEDDVTPDTEDDEDDEGDDVSMRVLTPPRSLKRA